jgi:hypothetical protein
MTVARNTRHNAVRFADATSSPRGGWRRFGSFATASVIACGAALPAAAAPEQAICAVEQAIACPPFEPCERNLPSAINLPILLKIDRPAGVIISRRDSGGERTSKIAGESGDDASHVLHGIDDGNPWSLRVNLTTGRFTLTSAQEDVGYIAFGLCSAKMLK